VRRYQVEPYVVAADVYGVAPHVGRGGWTWYTGSSGWMYRVALESVLGVRMEGGQKLVVRPCIPDDWQGFTMSWTLPGTDGTHVQVVVRNPHGRAATVVAARYDGRPVRISDGEARVPLLRDGQRHVLEVELGPGSV
jgi:cyclic beta-1,2-glucan synthetase